MFFTQPRATFSKPNSRRRITHTSDKWKPDLPSVWSHSHVWSGEKSKISPRKTFVRWTKIANTFKWRQHRDLHEGLRLCDPSQINKNDQRWQGCYNSHTHTFGNAMWLAPNWEANKAHATFPSMIILNNSLPCTLTAVWGSEEEGGHGAPRCDGSALICPVWPIHMCSHHCFHVLNRNCNVTQGNCKCSVQKPLH